MENTPLPHHHLAHFPRRFNIKGPVPLQVAVASQLNKFFQRIAGGGIVPNRVTFRLGEL